MTQLPTRTCEICGAPIGDLAGVCQACGTSYVAPGTEEPLVFNRPRWGIVKIIFAAEERGNESVISELRKLWQSLERDTFQKLAPSQLHLLIPGRAVIELVGPYLTYITLLEHFGDRMNVEFVDKTIEEVDELRAILRRSWDR